MKVLYCAQVRAVGGRNGTVESSDGVLKLPLSLPPGMGGNGGATNPEQLFAAGYAACFENALLHVCRTHGNPVPEDAVEVVADVGIGRTTGGFALTVALQVKIKGLSQPVAEEMVQAAHMLCPYSNAVRGNIDVQIGVSVS